VKDIKRNFRSHWGVDKPRPSVPTPERAYNAVTRWEGEILSITSTICYTQNRDLVP